MRAARPVLALALGLVAALSAVGVADAATKPKPKPVPPVCNLVTDAKGDGTNDLIGTGLLPSDAAWDITSADVASSGSKLTTVIRVAKLAKTAQTSPGGVQWRFNFVVGGTTLYTQVTQDTVLGLTGSYGYVDTISETLGSATPVLDMAKNEIRITVPTSGFASQAPIKTSGTALTALNPTAGRYYNLGAVTASEPSDEAVGSRSYSTGVKSCVVPGK